MTCKMCHKVRKFQLDSLGRFRMVRVLSRIFCLGGSRSLKIFWSHAAVRKNYFRPSRGVQGHAPQENFEKTVFRVG